jgi:non-ribosomal peptide synthase protein (TIGR01720 family)
LETDVSLENNRVETADTVSLSLSKEQTAALLREVSVVYNTQINDLLLSALVQTLCEPNQSILIEMEGHGREVDVVGRGHELDLSQTVGWFTSRYPIRLTHENNNTAALIKDTKAKLMATPNKGIGYGILKYLTSDPVIKQRFAQHQKPQLSFNYLGQFDHTQGDNSSTLFTAANENTGRQRSPDSLRSQLIELVAYINDDCLTVNWQFSHAMHDKVLVENIAQSYLTHLCQIIQHCLEEKSKLQLVSPDDTATTDNLVHSLRPSQPNVEEQLPLFCLHHRGGHTLEYREIAEQLKPSIPVYGIQSKILSDPHYQGHDMEAVAAQYAKAIRSTQSNGPYRLLGWSLGGVLAMAITQVLEAQGEQISFVGLIDASITKQTQDDDVEDSVIESLLAAVDHNLLAGYNRIDSDKRRALEKQVETLNEQQAIDFLCDWIIEEKLIDESVFDKSYLSIYYRTTLQSRRLIRSYQPKQINAKPHIWWAEDSMKKGEVPTHWQDYTSGIASAQTLPGGHFDIIKDPALHQMIAAQLEAL